MEPKQVYEILRSKANLEDNVKQALLDVIKTDPRYAYHYAKYTIRGRFPEAEEYIKTDPELAYKYAAYIIKGRWPEAEPYIKKHPDFVRLYAKYVMNDENFWENQAALEEFMNNVPKSKPNELDALKKQRKELDNKIKQLECA